LGNFGILSNQKFVFLKMTGMKKKIKKTWERKKKKKNPKISRVTA